MKLDESPPLTRSTDGSDRRGQFLPNGPRISWRFPKSRGLPRRDRGDGEEEPLGHEERTPSDQRYLHVR